VARFDLETLRDFKQDRQTIQKSNQRRSAVIKYATDGLLEDSGECFAIIVRFIRGPEIL